ncbi:MULTISPECIES: carotenoid oxygenase family protein [Cupriavidus]|uniref:Carotenoid cleavage oxygenase n=1 Tax=Cupriavidus laharis TaxID=151654 RepID=A0ABN7Z1P5_9BURK|nr:MULTISPECIES: carotenoid oxygenase family protein [Cupriavidus]CAG9179717.1 Carotenoid cleavage oxygenase [Cupriavidus laharis]
MKTISFQASPTIVWPNENPYLNDAWRPVDTEWTATSPDLEIIGEIPRDLSGLYVRNGHNPVHESIGRYHPYDGDGMVHAMAFHGGKVQYRNRWVRTVGFLAEQAAGKSLWPGIIEPRKAALRGWGSIGAMKDNAGTDIIVHGGKILAAMSQCSEPYRISPFSLETTGVEPNWARALFPRGICSHFKVDEHTGHMMFFNFGETPPYMNYGVVDRDNQLVHFEPIELPGPRWPHDLGMTENYCVLHDLPLFFDPERLRQGSHRLGFWRDVPSRFGIIPRFGKNVDVRWFEAEPCYILHLSNTFEEGDEVVMDGCIQTNPLPDISGLPTEGYERLKAMLDLHLQKARMHRWRFNLRTGQTREEDLDDQVTEFPMVNGLHNGRSYRYSYNAIPNKGFWLLEGLKKYDLLTGRTQTYMLPQGCYLSEAPFAQRRGATAEDDGYLVTFLTNLNTGKGECAIFDARDITRGPVARIVLPQQVPTGAHAFWATPDMLPDFEAGFEAALQGNY